MCIRDRIEHRIGLHDLGLDELRRPDVIGPVEIECRGAHPCLLYTSDAADERSSVDLGGRRIITQKNKTKQQL